MMIINVIFQMSFYFPPLPPQGVGNSVHGTVYKKKRLWPNGSDMVIIAIWEPIQ